MPVNYPMDGPAIIMGSKFENGHFFLDVMHDGRRYYVHVSHPNCITVFDPAAEDRVPERDPDLPARRLRLDKEIDVT